MNQQLKKIIALLDLAISLAGDEHKPGLRKAKSLILSEFGPKPKKGRR